MGAMIALMTRGHQSSHVEAAERPIHQLSRKWHVPIIEHSDLSLKTARRLNVCHLTPLASSSHFHPSGTATPLPFNTFQRFEYAHMVRQLVLLALSAAAGCFAAPVAMPDDSASRIPFKYHSHSVPALANSEGEGLNRRSSPIPFPFIHSSHLINRSGAVSTEADDIAAALNQIVSGNGIDTPDGKAPPTVVVAMELVPVPTGGTSWKYRAEMLDMDRFQLVPKPGEVIASQLLLERAQAQPQ